MTDQNRKPVRRFKAGSVSAAIWAAQVDKNGRTVTRICISIRGDFEHATETAGREKHGLCRENMNVACSKLHGNDAAAFITIHHHIDNLEFVKESHLIFDALLVKGLKDHMACPIRRIARPSDGCLAKVAGMATETALIDPPLSGTVER